MFTTPAIVDEVRRVLNLQSRPGNATYIVSDDKDLRVLSPFRGIEIVTVNRFLRRLRIWK